MQNIFTTSLKIKRASLNKLIDADEELAIEEPLEIQLFFGENKNLSPKTVSITMRTPGHDEELAIGFLFTEGIIQYKQQIAKTGVSVIENKVLITLHDNDPINLQNLERNFYTTSSCGVCGKTSIDAIKTISLYNNNNNNNNNNTTDEIEIKAGLFYHLEEEIRKQQTIFESTGGLHASALFDLNGQFISLREDVGRHNALDKLIGASFLNEELPLANRILLLSGRASFELVQKATMAGIKLIAAVGAPSSLAVQLAKESGITLIGFLRDHQFNIYSGEQRIMAG